MRHTEVDRRELAMESMPILLVVVRHEWQRNRSGLV
jgi:hypothetical protein